MQVSLGGKRIVTAEDTTLDDGKGDTLEILPLGSGQEVGRSAVILRYKGRTVLFDCGVHPAYTGESSLPMFDVIDIGQIDLALITHFHLDHCGAVPVLLKKPNFAGRCFMTHPTKAIYKMMLQDSVMITNQSSVEVLYTAEDLERSMERIELIDYHQQLEHRGIRFWCYNAGHVLGAAMFMVDIAGVKVLYTGDFSRHPDRHLMGAETPTIAPDIVIVESTYGTTIHEKREEREARFCNLVHSIVRRGGRCLLPVFALGRAQELLLILEEYWASHPQLHAIPIYYASSLSRKCMSVYRTYINMMNEHIRSQFEFKNPFEFKHISSLKSMQHFDDSGPCVVMASPGMLQSGLSRQLFERWVEDARNGLILPGYAVEGTLAKKLLSEPREVQLSSGLTVKRAMSIDTISFSAHSDFEQTRDFLMATRPQHIVLVHGEVRRMASLKQELDSFQFVPDSSTSESYRPKVHMPGNCESLKVVWAGEKRAKLVGQLAAAVSKDPTAGLAGILLQKDFSHFILAPVDLANYCSLSAFGFKQTLRVPFSSSHVDGLVAILRRFFTSVEVVLKATAAAAAAAAAAPIESIILSKDVLRIDLLTDEMPRMSTFSSLDGDGSAKSRDMSALLTWNGCEVNDCVADLVVAMMLQVESMPSLPSDLVRLDDELELVRKIHSMLKNCYGNVDCDLTERTFAVNFPDGGTVVIHYNTQSIEGDEKWRRRVEIMYRRIVSTVFPLPDDSCCD